METKLQSGPISVVSSEVETNVPPDPSNAKALAEMTKDLSPNPINIGAEQLATRMTIFGDGYNDAGEQAGNLAEQNPESLPITETWRGEGSAESAVDYWEEIAAEDGYVWFYNHTTQEYSETLPTGIAQTDENNTALTTELTSGADEFQQHISAGSAKTLADSPKGNHELEERAGIWEDGAEGEVFVPWPLDDPGDMKASPPTANVAGELPRLPEAVEEESEYEPDDPATVREQNVRALLVLLPARVVDVVVKKAMHLAILHMKREATAQAERRRRSLLATRAEYRHIRTSAPKNPVPGQVGYIENSGVRSDDESCGQGTGADEEARNTTTQERDVITGDKLAETLGVLLSGSKEEARLTMRRVCLSSQGIGPTGARELVPALKKCVIVALFLGNNAIGDKGAEALADGLRHARGLQELHLNDNEITDAGCDRLAVSLEPVPALTSLDLSHNPFGENGCRSLATLISQPGCPLQSLAVAGCLDVDPGAWKTIAPPPCKGENSKAQTRWIPPRPGDDGAVFLAAALMSPHGCPLRSFRLANAGIRAIGAKAIAAALCANENLEAIDLSGNDLAYKPDDVPGESAEESLKFGLQVNTTVHTITLRACGLAHSEVVGIQRYASGTTGKRKRPRSAIESRNGPSSNNGLSKSTRDEPLSWAHEKSLGYRAYCLQNWLLDAACVKGMQYPRELRADTDDTVPVIATASFEPGIQRPEHTTTATVSHSGNDSLSVVRGSVGRIEDEKWWSSLEPRLSRSILALRYLLESGTNAPASNQNGDKDNIDRGGHAPLTAETSPIAMLRELLRSEGSSGAQLEQTRTMLNVETMEVYPGAESIPKVESVAGHVDIKSTATTASRILAAAIHQNTSARSEVRLVGGTESQDSVSRSQANAGVETCKEAITNSETITNEHLPEEKSDSSAGENSIREKEKNSALTASARDILGLARAREIIFDVLSEAHPHSGRVVTAAALAKVAEEGRNLAKLSAQRRTELQNMADDSRRQLVCLRDARARFHHEKGKEVDTLRSVLGEAEALKIVASDVVRHLRPTEESARRTVRARKVELKRLEEGVQSTGGKRNHAEENRRRDDWQETVAHAEELAQELEDALKRLRHIERSIDDLNSKERALNKKLSVYSESYRERLNNLAMSIVDIRAKMDALQQAEITLADLAAKLDGMSRLAREEETLRDLVPAGSCRRDLDLHVADAVRVASAASAGINIALQRREEAAAMLTSSRPPWEASTLMKQWIAGEVGETMAATETQSAISAAEAAPGRTAETSLNDGPNEIFHLNYGSTGISAKGSGDDDNRECDDALSSDGAQTAMLDRRKTGVLTPPSPTAKPTTPSTSERPPDRSPPELRRSVRGNETNQPKVGLVERVDAEPETLAPDDRDRINVNFQVKGKMVNASYEAALSTAAVQLTKASQSSRTEHDANPSVLAGASEVLGSAPENTAMNVHGAFSKADQDYRDAVVRANTARVRQALALIRDHTAILRLREEDAEERSKFQRSDDLSRFTASLGALRRATRGMREKSRGGCTLVGAELNDRIALGARVALVHGLGVGEDEEEGASLPELGERGLTASQRVKRLQDARQAAEKEKKRAYTAYSRRVKRNLRAQKRVHKAKRRADILAHSMDAAELADCLRGRGWDKDADQAPVDNLRRAVAEEIRPQIRVRLHATSRWGKSAATKSGRLKGSSGGDVGIGEIAARRVRAANSIVPGAITETRTAPGSE